MNEQETKNLLRQFYNFMGTDIECSNADRKIDKFLDKQKAGWNNDKWLEQVSMPITKEQPKEVKEFEIVSFARTKSINELLNDNQASVKSGDLIIYSVRRLSDGEVFTIGDELLVGKIKSFLFDNSELKIEYEYKNLL